ncbi:MAG: hypothetical protein J5814_06995 [Bacteroidaceae bacterium]|nr:hypothetical protein [Bacteroidaceae bacterium]
MKKGKNFFLLEKFFWKKKKSDTTKEEFMRYDEKRGRGGESITFREERRRFLVK